MLYTNYNSIGYQYKLFDSLLKQTNHRLSTLFNYVAIKIFDNKLHFVSNCQ